VRNDQLDAAIVCLPAPTAGLRVATVTVSRSSPSFRHRARARTCRCPSRAWRAGACCCPREPPTPPCRDATLAAFPAAGAAPNLIERGETTVEQLLLAVLAGAGIALLPASAASRSGLPGLVPHPLADVDATVPMGFVTRNEAPGPVLVRLLDEMTLVDATAAA
jgi:DNA-binding transcriptional LysR family regulator